MKDTIALLEICDLVLGTFGKASSGYLGKDLFDKGGLPYDEEVFAFLVREGQLDEFPDGYKITYKGRITVGKGGLKRLYVGRIVFAASSIVAAITGIASLHILLL